MRWNHTIHDHRLVLDAVPPGARSALDVGTGDGPRPGRAGQPRGQHTAPVRLEFPHTYSEVRAIAAGALPGVRWRRLPLFRYALTWTKPA